MYGASLIGITSDVSFYVSLHTGNKYLILKLQQQGMNTTIFVQLSPAGRKKPPKARYVLQCNNKKLHVIM